MALHPCKGWLIGAVAALGILTILTAIFCGPRQSSTPESASKYHSSSNAPQESAPAVPEKQWEAPSPPAPPSRLTELRGSLARRREYDLWLIRNTSNVVNSALAKESKQGKILCYCLLTVRGAEQTLDSAPETEYALREDGTVLTTSGKPPRTEEQRFRDNERARFELETGGGPLVQDCAGSLFWFGTWNNKPMPTDEKFMEMIDEAKENLKEIDDTLDPRLVEVLPKPDAMQQVSPNAEKKPVEPAPAVPDQSGKTSIDH